MTKFVKCETEGCDKVVPKYSEKYMNDYPFVKKVYGYPQILKCEDHRK